MEAETYTINPEQIRDYLGQYSGIKTMKPEKQKEAIQTFVSKVVVYSDSIDIDIHPWKRPINNERTLATLGEGSSSKMKNFGLTGGTIRPKYEHCLSVNWVCHHCGYIE